MAAELKYLDQHLRTRRVKAKDLQVGMIHVLLMEPGKYELAVIRSIDEISVDSVQVNLGPAGHANRILLRDDYADVFVSGTD